MGKVVIVGSGNVGSCAALLLALRGSFDEVVLVDKRPARARAEAADLMAALPRLGAGAAVRAGDYGACAGAEALVLCAAAPVRLGQTRNDMFAKNAAIARDVVSSAEAAGFPGLYLVVSNPVDLLAHYLSDALGVPSGRVAGTGTLLDSMRLEDLVRAEVGARDACALALGEHGEGLVVDWGRTLADGAPVPEGRREPLRRSAIELAYEIVKGKGSTSYGIAQAVASILEARRSRDGRVLPLSVAPEGAYGIDGVRLALPAAFGEDGAPRVVELGLGEDVVARLREVARSMREFYDEATRPSDES